MDKAIRSKYGLTVGLCLIFGWLHSQPLLLDSNKKSYDLIDYLEIYITEDTLSGFQAFEKIQTKELIQVETGSNPGMNTYNAYWMRFSLENKLDLPARFYIEVDYPQLDYLALYQLNSGVEELYVTGDRFPFDQRPVLHRNFLLPIDLDAGERKSFLLNVDKRLSVTRFPVSIYHEDLFSEKSVSDTIFYGIYFGVLAVLIILSITVGIRLRQKVFLWYAFYLFSFASWLFCQTGYSYQFITGDYPELNLHILPVFTQLAVMSIILYVQSFFNTRNLLPRFHKIMTGIFIFFVMAYLVWLIIPNVYIAYAPSLFMVRYALVLTVVIFGFTSAIKALKVDRFKAISFLIAYSIFYLGIISKIVAELGWINEDRFMYDPILLGFMIEVAVLSYAMITLITRNISEREKLIEENRALSESVASLIENESPNTPEYISLKSKAVIQLGNLIYIKADDHYLEFYLLEGSTEIDRNSLKSIREELPDHFMQVHRSYLVNMEYVKAIYASSVLLKNGEELPLTRTYKKNLEEILYS